MANREKRFETIYTQGTSLSIVVDTETRQSDRGIVYPIADTSGDFKRLYGCNFTENRPETIH